MSQDRDENLRLATGALDNTAFEDVPVVQFTKNLNYTTFEAEHGVDGADLVFHFFPSKEYPKWPTGFAQALEATAMAYFNVGQPTLTAAFTEEMNSWWLRARGFADVGDPAYRAAKLYDALDAAIEARSQRG